MNSQSCFANFPVRGQICWPRIATVFAFGEHEIHAFPASKDHAASLHIDLARSRLDDVGGRNVLHQLLSIAAWLDDDYAILHNGWSGNPMPVRPNRVGGMGEGMSSIVDHWCNFWAPIEDATVRRALAIYREALNLQYQNATTFAAVGFYKAFEIKFDGREKRDYFYTLSRDFLSDSRFVEDYLSNLELRALEFSKLPNAEELADFLFNTGRNAVAHANHEPWVDPDDVSDVRKIWAASNILRAMSRRMISEELGVSTERWADGYKG